MALVGQLDVTANPESVEFAFTVENPTTNAVDLEFHSGFVADFTVYADGSEIWRYSDGRMFTQALQSETLEPGEAFTYTGVWEGPSPGDYEVVATLETRTMDVDVRAAFSVP